jgi:hypothetical protein
MALFLPFPQDPFSEEERGWKDHLGSKNYLDAPVENPGTQ